MTRRARLTLRASDLPLVLGALLVLLGLFDVSRRPGPAAHAAPASASIAAATATTPSTSSHVRPSPPSALSNRSSSNLSRSSLTSSHLSLQQQQKQQQQQQQQLGARGRRKAARDIRTVEIPPQPVAAPNSQPVSNHRRAAVTAMDMPKCLYTRASPNIIADSRGYVCASELRLPGGCCPTPGADKNAALRQGSSAGAAARPGAEPTQHTPQTQRYRCAGCAANHCCSEYEHCVSCCQSPAAALIRREAATRRSSLALYRMRATFQLCVAACRSSSSSVVHENAYRHLRHHCFGAEQPDIDPVLHRGIFDFASPITSKR